MRKLFFLSPQVFKMTLLPIVCMHELLRYRAMGQLNFADGYTVYENG
jgi:hypothetical protein